MTAVATPNFVRKVFCPVCGSQMFWVTADQWWLCSDTDCGDIEFYPAP